MLLGDERSCQAHCLDGRRSVSVAGSADIPSPRREDPILDGITDWLGVLHYVAGRAEERKGLVLSLDEFPYLVGGNPALPSIMQKFWDTKVAEKGALKI